MNPDLLTAHEFDTHLKEGTFRLSFVGMSNAGKSYRAKILRSENDFLWYHVDEEIQKALGLESMKEISSWLGQPTHEGYAAREEEYLRLEQKYTEQASMQTNGKNLVFDTTGSVVHLPQKTLELLKENCLLVHLSVGEKDIENMIEKFFEDPKPVAWCGQFSIQAGESNEDALRRAYPDLLRERLQRYNSLAHIVVPASEVRDATGEQTLAAIRRRL